MKKSIKIAALGVAALGFAAAPAAGVFADDPQDSISVTIGSNCAFSQEAKGTFTDSSMTVSDTADFGTEKSSYKVVCNNQKGYTVKATFAGLTGNQTTPVTIGYDGSKDPTAGTATWAAYKNTGSTPSLVVHNSNIAEATAATSSTTWDVTYKVATGSNQEQGTYTGTATYTFAEKTS